MPSYFEFFCGGGMVRAGLGSEWRCLLANDFDPKKADTYALNWGKETLIVGDVRNIGTKDLLARSNGECVDLAWASFPCQDLSLAGGGAGLRGERSGTFWPFWEKMNGLAKTGKHPRIVALENVCGALTSHDGNDFVAITNALIKLDYKVGAIVIDARKFLPQSRPRLFFICIRSNIDIPIQLTEDTPSPAWHPSALVKAQERLQGKAKANWVWWNPPPPPPRRKYLRQVIETGSSETWHSRDESSYLISMMNDVNLNKLKQAQRQKKPIVGTMYRRTRYERGNGKVQRVEVRFDGIAGCLRTPAGGSSRQFVIAVEGDSIRTRLMSPRETARLMGLDQSYRLPDNFNEALHLTGDGVAVPVVRYLAKQLFEPIVIPHQRTFDFAA